jgi:hypothetical protein
LTIPYIVNEKHMTNIHPIESQLHRQALKEISQWDLRALMHNKSRAGSRLSLTDVMHPTNLNECNALTN